MGKKRWFWQRLKYEFTHPQAGGPVIFKARNDIHAWQRMRRYVFDLMFGAMALQYEPAALDERLNEITCHRIEENGEKVKVPRPLEVRA